MLTYGQDDHPSWVLLPLLSTSLAISLTPFRPRVWVLLPLLSTSLVAACLAAIVYALMPAERWNARHNPGLSPDAPAGATQWLTVIAVVLALMVGATAFMASLAFSFQRYFEYPIEEGLRISQ